VQLDWITDPHLDHLPNQKALVSFIDKLHARPSDGLMITGDIAESNTIYEYLGLLSGAYQKPVYFVLGNHDYYRGWMEETRNQVRTVCRAVPEGILNWMPEAGPIMLDDDTAIIGHGGFYDGQEGEPGLELQMSDFFMPNGVRDLVQATGFGSRHLFQKLLDLGTECAESISAQVKTARRQGAVRVLILTHVPPFLEASYFRGKPSSDKAAPFYVNRCLGNALMELASNYPAVQFEVFAGHTHGKREYRAAKNLEVRVGSARYGRQPIYQLPVMI
jgi:predicted phosphodiesterase